jgi:hypothetical protein
MAGRIRSLKPEWLENQRLGSCSDAARLLSVALILLADDHGRGRAAVPYIAGQVWTYTLAKVPETLARVSAALSELVATGYIQLYEVEGQDYFEILGWSRHQRVDKPGKPRVPDPRLGNIRETPAKVPGSLAPDHDHDHDHDHDQRSRPRPVAAPARRALSGDHQAFVARFDELYAAKNLGSRPSWGGKQGKLVKELLQRPGGLPEALKRAENMFCAPPPWPAPPHDLGTLVQHYDRFARPHNGAKVGHYQHTGDEEYAGGDVDL